MKFANESYVLGIPEHLLIAAAREVGWYIVQVDRLQEATHVTLRRHMTAFDRHTVVLPADMRRRDVIPTLKVQLRLKGA